LLFAGTAIGAGMLALPAETAQAGYIPSLLSLALCWLFTYVTSLITLEASWKVSHGGGDLKVQAESEASYKEEGGNGKGGFLTVAKKTLGPVGESITALFFWFLLTSIVVAYTSEGGELVSQFFSMAGGNGEGKQELIVPTLVTSPIVGSIVFMLVFATMAILGTEKVDLVNRFLVVGLLGSFMGLLGLGIPQIDTSLLFSRSDWTTVYPQVISIGILAFGAQNVVPTLLQYLGGDAIRTERAILVGSLIPLIMYYLWESVFLGIVPWDPNVIHDNKMQVVTALGSTEGETVRNLVEVFSACAIGSSMAGASVSLVDFFQDFLATHKKEFASSSTGRLVAAFLSLGPALGLACAFPDAFLSVLENAGLIGGVTLYGIIPVLAVIRLRNDLSLISGDLHMPTRLPGGITSLYFLLSVSLMVLVPDVIKLGETIFAGR
jgi:tyrosine-specific transport protein